MNLASTMALTLRIQALSRPRRPYPLAFAPRVHRVHGITAILFDVYGTLLVSASGDIGTDLSAQNPKEMRAALLAAGVRILDASASSRALTILHAAIRRSHAARRARGAHTPEVEIRLIWLRVLRRLVHDGLVLCACDRATAARLAVEFECRSNPVWPMPGLRPMFAALRNRGLHLGAVSNAQFYTPLQFRAFLNGPPRILGLEPGLCVWSYLAGEAKPSLRLWQEALRRLHARHAVRPSQVLVVGNDLFKDIAPAQQLGCHTAWFVADARAARPWPPPTDALAPHPDHILTKLAQVAAIVA